MLVLLNPVTYFAIAGSIAALDNLPDDAAFFRRLVAGISLVLLMPPLAWMLDQMFKPGQWTVKGEKPREASIHRTTL